MDNIKLVPLSELIVSINSGLNPRKNFNIDNKVKAGANFCMYVNVSDLSNLTRKGEFTCNFISEEAKQMINKKSKLEKGDILLPAYYTDKINFVQVGNIANVMDISENIYAIKANEKIDKEYLFQMLNSKFVIEQIKEKTEGKVLKRIKKDVLNNILIPVPSNEIQPILMQTLSRCNRIIDISQEIQDKQENAQEIIKNCLWEIANKYRGTYDFTKEIKIAERLAFINKSLEDAKKMIDEIEIEKSKLLFNIIKEKENYGQEAN